jgi:hypothetical protein
VFEPGDPIDVATEDTPNLVFDASGTVVRASTAQGAATVRLDNGDVEMFSLRRLRPATRP